MSSNVMHPFEVAERVPDLPAIVMASDGTTLTYRALADRIRQIQHLLRSNGVRRGDGVALFAENRLDYLPMTWAAQSSGCYYTTINSHLTVDEVAYIVNDCGAKLLVTTRARADVAVGLTPAAIPGVEHRLMMDAPLDGWRCFDDEAGVQATTPIDDSCEGDFFLYSSGTTGRPKGIRRELQFQPLGTGLEYVVSFLKLLGIDTGDVYLSPAPLYHAAPLACGMGVHRLGATAIVMEKFDPQRALELIEQHRVTTTQMVPTMFVRMLKLPDETRRKYDLGTLRRIVHAAAPCPQDVKRAMIDWVGPIIDEYYAASEGPGTTYITSEDWLAHPGSVGKPLVGIPHILDEDGNALPPGEVGTIWFENASKFEYNGDPVETAKTRNADGWVTVGDVGHLDAEGYLYLSDRKAFMIISGGVNIYPQEIENALISHPRVQDVAVFGVPNEDFGEEVKAVVQLVDGADAGDTVRAELIEYCRSRIAGYKVPRSIDFVEQLPRLDTGKLYKKPLRDKYWADAASPGADTA